MFLENPNFWVFSSAKKTPSNGGNLNLTRHYPETSFGLKSFSRVSGYFAFAPLSARILFRMIQKGLSQ